MKQRPDCANKAGRTTTSAPWSPGRPIKWLGVHTVRVCDRVQASGSALGGVLYLAAVGPGTSLGRPSPRQSFGLRDDRRQREAGTLDVVYLAQVSVGGALRFG